MLQVFSFTNEISVSKYSYRLIGVGTGKSYILSVLQQVLSNLNMSEKIAFTAPTGVAACNIHGLTIHSWAGIGLAREPLDQLVASVCRSRQARGRWNEVDILVIDEISMLSAEVFEKLSVIGQRARNDPRPFGGIQLILCGDFFQLPPVGKFHFCSTLFLHNIHIVPIIK